MAMAAQTRVDHANDMNVVARVHAFDDTVERFLNVFVPSKEVIPRSRPREEEFVNTVSPNLSEDDIYDAMVKGLSALTAEFPTSKKMRFADNGDNPIKFPYAQYDLEQYKANPDIVSSLPGHAEYSLARPRWREISLAWEVNTTRRQDPLRKDFVGHTDTIAQLAKSARNIMASRSSLFTFVVGIYGDTARIYRFDLSAAVVSRAFIHLEEPHLLHEFLWRFVNPMDNACTIVGDDPIVRLAGPDNRRLAEELAKTHKKCVFDDGNRKAWMGRTDSKRDI